MQEVFAIPVVDEIRGSSNEENKENNKSNNTNKAIEENSNTTEMSIDDLDELFNFENIA